MASLILCALLIGSDVKVANASIDDVVDIIELNHCLDFRGKLAFKQLIFYRWSSYHRRFQIVDTVMVNGPSMVPKKQANGLFVCRWKDSEGERTVRGMTYRESRTCNDPEVRERNFLPTHLRKGLKQIRPTFPNPQTEFLRTSGMPIRPQKLVKF